MATRPIVAPLPAGREQPIEDQHSKSENGRTDWLHDPLEAQARPRGPYTVINAEEFLDEYPVELYNGWLVWQEMTDITERRAMSNIQEMLSISARKIGFGQGLMDQHECLLANGDVIKPDASLISWQRLNEKVVRIGPNDRPTLLGSPELVIESRLPSNRRRQEARKRAQYFANGTQIVWDVDEVNQVIYVYRAESPQRPQRFSLGEIIDCEPLIPGWRRHVADIFAEQLSAEAMAGEVADAWKEEGIAIGEAQGKEQRTREMARVMHEKGLAISMIADVSEVDEETVRTWLSLDIPG